MKKYLLLLSALLLVALTMCGAALATESEACTHPSFAYRNTIPATCTEYGSHEKYCPSCGWVVGTEKISPLGHKMEGDYKIAVEPTCTTPGRKDFYCSVCKTVQQTEVIPQLGHDMGSWYTTKTLTCTEDGEERRDCSRCDHFELRALPHPGHKLTEWAVVAKPSCTTKGMEERHCTNTHLGCTLSETRDLDPLGHNYAEIGRQEPNCTNDGYKDVLCSRCGDTKRETLPKLGHLWSAWRQTIPPTCVSKGRVERHCTRVGCTASETDEVDMLPHSWTDWRQIEAPNCTKEGRAERHCLNGCGQYQYQSVPALGHNWGSWITVTQPNCTVPGQRKHTCTRPGCGATETESIPALGHSWGDWVTVTEPSCTVPGQRKHSCTRPGCTAVEYGTIPALGHAWGPWVIDKQPTCEEAGVRRRSCTRPNCPAYETESIPPTGHDAEWVVVIRPTFTSEGEEHYVCKVCDKVLKIRKIPRLTLNNNTMCAMGPRLRDVDLSPNPNSDRWYMFTPVDVFMDGVQKYDLVASNLYVVGTMTVTVENGVMTVDYDLNSDKIKIDLEFFTVLHSMKDIDEYEPEQLLSLRMRAGEPIDLEEKFGMDTNLVVYFCSRVSYTYDSANMKPYSDTTARMQKVIQHMLMLMD